MTEKIPAPGFYPGLKMADYLAMPAVSASLLQILDDECPRAAWYASWLNPEPARRRSEDNQAAGTVAHGILLEGSTANVVVVEADDWRTKAAREERGAAELDGKVAVLAKMMPVVNAMVDAARKYIDSLRHAPPEDLARSVWALFQDGAGESELTVVWDDDGVPCRIRPDRMALDRSLIVDYKTCKASAEPDSWGRTYLANMGYYKSGGFYRRGVKALTGVLPEYVFLAQEQDPPYLCSLIGMDPQAQALGARFAQRSIDVWRACAKSGNWPAYPNRVCYPELPPWEVARDAEHDFSGNAYDYEQLFGDIRREREAAGLVFADRL